MCGVLDLRRWSGWDPSCNSWTLFQINPDFMSLHSCDLFDPRGGPLRSGALGRRPSGPPSRPASRKACLGRKDPPTLDRKTETES